MSICEDHPKNRYFLTKEVEVTREEYIRAEQACGFYPKSGNGLATGGFHGTTANGELSGRVEYSREPRGPYLVCDRSVA